MAENNPEKTPGAFSLLGTASTMGLHMVSGPVVGGGLGWLIDKWLGSWPVGATIGLLLGVAAGFRNVWADARYLQRSNAAIDAERKKQEEKPVEGPSMSKKDVFVPAVHKGESGSVVGEAVQSDDFQEQRAGAGESQAISDEDVFTASVFAGVASVRDQDAVDLDETEEAIRRALGCGGGSSGKK